MNILSSVCKLFRKLLIKIEYRCGLWKGDFKTKQNKTTISASSPCEGSVQLGDGWETILLQLIKWIDFGLVLIFGILSPQNS